MSTATEPVIENPTSEHGNLALGGDSFAALVKERKVDADAIVDAPEKVDPPAKPTDTPPPKPAEKAEDKKGAADTKTKVPGKTPLDLAPPKKDDAPPADAEIAELLKSEPPANASPSSKANHAAMRKGLEHANTTILSLKAELAETKGKVGAVPVEVEDRLKTAEETLKQREAELERVAFERSPRYQKFVSEGEAELTAAKSYLEGVKNDEGEAIDPNVIDLAARAKGPKRADILDKSGLNQTTISAVTSHLARADAIDRDREAAQENWKRTSADWTAEQTKAHEARAAQVKANEDKVFTDVGKKMAETLAPFQTAEGNDDWNTGKDERFKTAQLYFDGKKSLAETAEIIYKGVACEVYKDAFEDLRTKYNDLVGETERIKAARPGAATSSADGAAPVVTGDPMKMAASSFDERRRNRSG